MKMKYPCQDGTAGVDENLSSRFLKGEKVTKNVRIAEFFHKYCLLILAYSPCALKLHGLTSVGSREWD
jgi:hypothetical protein